MVHLIKHLAVRLWTTLVVGSLAALTVMTPLADVVGPGWMIIPGLVVLAAAYWLTGVAFVAMGNRRIQRLLDEATVWERAGMPREARQTLSRAAATVDSFFFSPLSCKGPAKQLLAQTARFQMAQATPEPTSVAVFEAYLSSFPHDREAAIKWLDKLLAKGAVTAQAHDIAARIGGAHTKDTAIQRMLAQFYLADRRGDFVALETYRQVLDGGKALPQALHAEITDLFLAQSRTDDLALKAYLVAHECGGGDMRLLPAIAACRRSVHPGPLTQPLLERADAVLAGIDTFRRDSMADGFVPDSSDMGLRRSTGTRRIRLPAIGTMIQQAILGLKAVATTSVVMLSRLGRSIRTGLLSAPVLSALKWAALGLALAGVGWLVVNTAMHLAPPPKPVETAPVPEALPVTDPFTIQVAAYLKEVDARRYVDQLKGKGLDAYWNRVSGSGKTWYQVRVSHFATKAAARAAGDDLKKRGLIGDYYVANYKRPDVP